MIRSLDPTTLPSKSLPIHQSFDAMKSVIEALQKLKHKLAAAMSRSKHFNTFSSSAGQVDASSVQWILFLQAQSPLTTSVQIFQYDELYYYLKWTYLILFLN
jgi:hypothetical protein